MPLLRIEEASAVGRDELQRRFATAAPFPHLVLDDFLRADQSLTLEEFPNDSWDGWSRFTDGNQHGKHFCQDIDRIPPLYSRMLQELSSPRCLAFFEDVTGIKGLLPDPYLDGGGLHATTPGGVLAPHTDFHLYPRLGLYRRLNALIYLNPDWQPSDGGTLGLYDGSMRATVELAPLWGRCVLFATDDKSVHGFSQPVTGGMRRSVAVYYYTTYETASYSGDRSTHWRVEAPPLTRRARLRGRLSKALLIGSRGLSRAAHGLNPNRSG